MKILNSRLAEPRDAEDCARWTIEGGNPASTALTYPSTLTVAVDEDDEPVLYQTLHPVLMLEAMVLRPGISTLRAARGIKELYVSMKRLAESYGMKEMYLFTPYEAEQLMLEKHNMFHKVEMPCYRCRL
jgi:hypothetical protein